jgi:hypothetical protein
LLDTVRRWGEHGLLTLIRDDKGCLVAEIVDREVGVAVMPARRRQPRVARRPRTAGEPRTAGGPRLARRRSGLWLVRRLVDEMAVWSRRRGTIMRLVVRLPGPQDCARNGSRHDGMLAALVAGILFPM